MSACASGAGRDEGAGSATDAARAPSSEPVLHGATEPTEPSDAVTRSGSVSTSTGLPTTSTAPARTGANDTATARAPTSISLGPPTTSATPATPAPSTTDPRPSYDACVEHEGRYRCWLEQAPAQADRPTPLVIDLHGYTGDARGQRDVSGFRELAERDGFVVVWPEGVDRSWSAGACCGAQVADDVGFLRAVVDDVSERRSVDRVYVTGLSNGCAMAQRMAAEASDVVDAVACLSFFLLSEPAADYRPVPVLEIHGTADPVVAYEFEPVFGGAVGNYERWRSTNGCSGPDAERPFEGTVGSIRYDPSCPDGAVVALVTLTDAGHVPYPGIDTDVATSELAWRFMNDPIGTVRG